MEKIIRTQINKDGTVSIWNSSSGSKGMKYSVIPKPKYISIARIATLNTLREFNKLSNRAKFLLTNPDSLAHIPSERGNCLSIVG